MAEAANEVSVTGCLWILLRILGVATPNTADDLHGFASSISAMAASFDSEKAWKRMEAQSEPLPVPGRKRTMMHNKTD